MKRQILILILLISLALTSFAESMSNLNGNPDLAQALNQAKSSRNWIIAGAFMLFVITLMLIRQIVTARKNNLLISQQNEALQRFLSEKDWLIKEVHHRVKNNLHTLICLLESQARYLKDDALKAVETSQNRIFAMSLIHQKLYRSEDIKTINMAEYVPELVSNLRRSFDIPERINFEIDVAAISLSASHAIPFGLIINEAVTNAIKYAFPANKKGTISVIFYQYQQELILTIADDGIGMPCNGGEQACQSLGIELIKGLCHDINAEICFHNNMGTRIIINCDPAHCSAEELVVEADHGLSKQVAG